MDSYKITKISLLIALSIIIKLVTDIFTRSFLMFLFIDPIIMFTAYIIVYHSKLNMAIILSVLQTLLSYLIFPTTDIWFIRPFIPIICFLYVSRLNKKDIPTNKKVSKAVFICSYMSILLTALTLVFFLFMMPSLFPMDTIVSTLAKFNDIVDVGTLKNVMAVILIIMGFIYSFVPAFSNMFIVKQVLKFVTQFNNRNKKREY